MLPEGWKISTLGEVCQNNLQTGPFGSQLHANEYEDRGVPVLMPKDLNGFRAITSNAAKISPERARDLAKHRLSKGDLLFSRRGDVTRFALIDENTEGALCGTGCLKATPGPDHSPEFLAYFLQKHWVRKWLEQNAVGQTMPNMNTSILSELPLMVAGSRQQEDTIAKILSTWDQAITATERLLENSQQRKKGLMQQLLTGKKRFVEARAGLTPQKTRIGEIPGDWNYPGISDICSQITDKNTDDQQLPVLSCSKYVGFVDSLSYFKKKVYSDDLKGYRIIPRGCIGFPSNHIEEGSIGLQSLYDWGLVSPIYVVARPDSEKVNADYLYAVLKTDHYRQIFCAATNASVDRRGSLRWKEFSQIHVPLPPLPEQNQTVEVLQTAAQEITALQTSLKCLKQEKKALMQQLLTGKRRVKVEADAA